MSDSSCGFRTGIGGDRTATNYWQYVVPVVGAVLLVGAGAKSIHTLSSTGILLEALLDFLLLGSMGVVTLAVGAWLPSTDLEPECYQRIALWVAGGVGVMAVVLGLRVLHPGVTVEFTFGTQAVFLAIGSLAGLGIGVHEAQALQRARMLAEQNDELEATKERLDDVVAQLAAPNDQLEASNRQLEASNRQLEASNEQLEQFAYAASHDLREPLRMVRSYLELIERRSGDELDDECEEFLAFAVDGASRMDEMVDSLLEYSRVETQGESFDAVDLDAVLDDVLADLQMAIEESDAEITREPLPTVEGDGRQLRQVVQNLVSNAIQYSGDEPPRIHVSATQGDDEWTLQIRDEGPGIDPGDAERVFDIFERLHSTEEESGSGIGLALCDRIVERHDGEIWVDSEPGDGSTFSVSLPSEGPDAEDADTELTGAADGDVRPGDDGIGADRSTVGAAIEEDGSRAGSPPGPSPRRFHAPQH